MPVQRYRGLRVFDSQMSSSSNVIMAPLATAGSAAGELIDTIRSIRTPADAGETILDAAPHIVAELEGPAANKPAVEAR